jgi:hypothetical protein
MGISSLLRLRKGDGFALFGSCLVGYLVGRIILDPNWSIQAYILISYHLFLGFLLATRGKENKHPVPVAAGIAIHLAFVAAIVGIGLLRHYIPYFSLVRYAIAGVAVFERWFLFGPDSDRDETELAAGSGKSQVSFSSYQTQPVTNLGEAQMPLSAVPAVATAAPPRSASVTGLDFFHQPAKSPSSSTASSLPVPLARPRELKIAAKNGKKPVDQGPYVSPIMTATSDDYEAWLRYLSTRNPTHRKRSMNLGDEYEDWLQTRARARAAASPAIGPSQTRAGAP